MHRLKWLYPGMKVKRWVFLFAAGIILALVSGIRFFFDIDYYLKTLDAVFFVLAVFVLVISMYRMVGSIVAIFMPQDTKGLVDIVYKKRYLEKGPKVVAIGGGTGLSVLLEGLKEETSNITAIVTVADDGGSSGKIRRQFDMLPPGDIRNCLVALADAPALMRELFQFRFGKDANLEEHNFGNLFITVMTKLTGDFEKAIKESSRVLAIRGQVIPSTLENVALVAEHKDGTTTEGEAQIPERHTPIKRVYLKPGDPQATPDAIKAIYDSDIIVLGPGSLYTSIIPNLLVKEITDAVVESQAPKIYVCNVMTQFGETDGFSAFDHVKNLLEHSNPKIINYCVVNVSKIADDLLFKYRQENAYQVRTDSDRIRKLGYRVIEDMIVSESTDFIRHDPKVLSRIIMRLAKKGVSR